MEKKSTAELTRMTRESRCQGTRDRAATLLQARRLAAMGDVHAANLLTFKASK